MDHMLRLLERRAALGDLAALGALQRAHRRCGRGWFGERLHPRMVLGSREPLYLYDPGKGHRIEMVWLPPKGEERGLWMSRGVVTLKLFVTFCRATGAPLPDRGLDVFTLDQARAYARWAGVTLPARHELDRAARFAQGSIFSPPPGPQEHWQRERWSRCDRASFRVLLRSSPAAGPRGRPPPARAGRGDSASVAARPASSLEEDPDERRHGRDPRRRGRTGRQAARERAGEGLREVRGAEGALTSTSST